MCAGIKTLWNDAQNFGHQADDAFALYVQSNQRWSIILWGRAAAGRAWITSIKLTKPCWDDEFEIPGQYTIRRDRVGLWVRKYIIYDTPIGDVPICVSITYILGGVRWCPGKDFFSIETGNLVYDKPRFASPLFGKKNVKIEIIIAVFFGSGMTGRKNFPHAMVGNRRPRGNNLVFAVRQQVTHDGGWIFLLRSILIIFFWSVKLSGYPVTGRALEGGDDLAEVVLCVRGHSHIHTHHHAT